MEQYIILSVIGCLGTTVLVQAHKFARTEAHTNLKHPKSQKMNNSNDEGSTAFPKVSPFPVMLVEHRHGVISEWQGRIVEYHVRDMVTVISSWCEKQSDHSQQSSASGPQNSCRRCSVEYALLHCCGKILDDG